MLIAFIGGGLALKEKLLIADLFALLTLVPRVSARFFSLPAQIQKWYAIRGKCENLNSFLENSESEDRGEILTNKMISRVEICNVSFSYEPSKQVLKHVTFTISQSGLYVLAGASGCGKSTLLKLIAKLLPYETGYIKINEQDLKNLERKFYWKRVGYVAQESFIMSGTLLYNITLEDSLDYNDKKNLEYILNGVDLENFISQRQGRIYGVVTEEEMSKGERVKINIARALYRKPKILLMDEMTEGLDPEAEVVILRFLKDYIKKSGMIAIAISHHVKTFYEADKIILMKDGRIEAIEKHSILFDSNSAYRRLLAEG